MARTPRIKWDGEGQPKRIYPRMLQEMMENQSVYELLKENCILAVLGADEAQRESAIEWLLTNFTPKGTDLYVRYRNDEDSTGIIALTWDGLPYWQKVTAVPRCAKAVWLDNTLKFLYYQ